MKGGLKPEYYIRKGIFLFFIFDQVLNGSKTTHTMSSPSYYKSDFRYTPFEYY